MLKKNVLLVLGAGGHGKSVAEAALLSGKWKKWYLLMIVGHKKQI